MFGPDGPCYACLFPPEHPPGETRCATLGVFSPLVGLMGSLQATEALRWLGQRQLSLTGRLLQVDARDLQWQDIRLSRRQGCPVCSH